MTALEFLKELPRNWLPVNTDRGIHAPSNSDLWRWLKNGSVVINGLRPKPNDAVEFPVIEFVFFPKGRRVTIIKGD